MKLANEFLKGTITSVTAFPKVSLAPDAELCCYAFNHAPKLAAIWSQVRYTDEGGFTRKAAIEGIIYMTSDAENSSSVELRHEQWPGKGDQEVQCISGDDQDGIELAHVGLQRIEVTHGVSVVNEQRQG